MNINKKDRVLLGSLLAGLTVASAYHLVVRPWQQCWGASLDDVNRSLPGDGLITAPMSKTTRAISILAPQTCTWSWIVQIGQGRGGFYSYDWLENLLRMNIHNVKKIVPELQTLQVGDPVPFWEGVGLKVLAIDPPHSLVLGGTLYSDGLRPMDVNQSSDPGVAGVWIFIVDPDRHGNSRLIIRSLVAEFKPVWLSRLFLYLLEPAHFIMERKMMLEIKRLAELASQ